MPVNPVMQILETGLNSGPREVVRPWLAVCTCVAEGSQWWSHCTPGELAPSICTAVAVNQACLGWHLGLGKLQRPERAAGRDARLGLGRVPEGGESREVLSGICKPLYLGRKPPEVCRVRGSYGLFLQWQKLLMLCAEVVTKNRVTPAVWPTQVAPAQL